MVTIVILLSDMLPIFQCHILSTYVNDALIRKKIIARFDIVDIANKTIEPGNTARLRILNHCTMVVMNHVESKII